MSKKSGLRDDDTLGRLADLERRVEELEPSKKPAPKPKDD